MAKLLLHPMQQRPLPSRCRVAGLRQQAARTARTREEVVVGGVGEEGHDVGVHLADHERIHVEQLGKAIKRHVRFHASVVGTCVGGVKGCVGMCGDVWVCAWVGGSIPCIRHGICTTPLKNT